MYSMITAVILCLAVLGSMWAYTRKKIPAWNERGFDAAGLQWGPVVTGSLIGGAVAGALGFGLSGQWYVAVVLSVLGYLSVLATATDLSVMKIPSDISIMAYWLPVALPVLWWTQIDTFSLVAWAIMVGVLTVMAVVSRGMGFADLRILFFTTTGLAWWVGIMPMLYALMGACLLQIVLFVVTARMNFGVVKEVGADTVVNPETRKLEGAVDGVEPEGTASDSVKKKKKKRHTPFGPSLLVSFLVAALFVAATQDLAPLDLSNTVLSTMF